MFSRALLAFFTLLNLGGCQPETTPAPATKTLKAGPEKVVELASQVHYHWGSFLRDPDFGLPPERWQQYFPYTVRLRLWQRNRRPTELIPKASERWNIGDLKSADDVVKLPATAQYLLRSQPLQKKPRGKDSEYQERAYERFGDVLAVSLQNQDQRLLVMAPEHLADCSIKTLKDPAAFFEARKDSRLVVDERALACHSVTTLIKAWQGPERPYRNSLTVARQFHVGLTVDNARSPSRVRIGLTWRVGEDIESVFLKAFELPAEGLNLAVALRSPFVEATATTGCLVLGFELRPSTWQDLSRESLVCAADLGRQRILAEEEQRLRRQNRPPLGREDKTQAAQEDLLTDLELLDLPGFELPKGCDWRTGLERFGQWVRARKVMDASTQDQVQTFLERHIGDVWCPSPRRLSIQSLREWCQRTQTSLDEMADGEWLSVLVEFNHRSLRSESLARRWRAYSWLEQQFPELPQRPVHFSVDPNPSFLLIVDSVLERAGFAGELSKDGSS